MAGKAKQELVPRVESSEVFAGKRLNNRARAVLEDVFGVVTKREDFQKALVAQFVEDPLGCIERLIKLTPTTEEKPNQQNFFAIKDLYLTAVQAANPPRVIELEHEPGTTRVQPDVSDW